MNLDKIIVGDCIEVMNRMRPRSVHTVVTSPPYWNLRDYGIEGQIGQEKTPKEYIRNMVRVFAAVHRALRNDGTLWLNLGDTYASSGKARTGRGGYKDGRSNREKRRQAGGVVGVPAKNLLGIPWRVAFALQRTGWILRQEIIWHKSNPMTSSATDRFCTAHEHLFLLTKNPLYFFDQTAVLERATQIGRIRYDRIGGNKHNGTTTKHSDGAMFGGSDTRIPRTVWSVPLKGFKGAHFAVFPESLILPCIKAGSSEEGCCSKCGAPVVRQIEKTRVTTRPGRDTKVTGDAMTDGNRDPARHITRTKTIGWKPSCDCGAEVSRCVVLDPFMGSGTVGAVAKRLGRCYIGIELNPKYAAMAERRISLVKPGMEVG